MSWENDKDRRVYSLAIDAEVFMDLGNNTVSGICFQIIYGWVESGWDICETEWLWDENCWNWVMAMGVPFNVLTTFVYVWKLP